jgi:hypothetical protein
VGKTIVANKDLLIHGKGHNIYSHYGRLLNEEKNDNQCAFESLPKESAGVGLNGPMP